MSDNGKLPAGKLPAEAYDAVPAMQLTLTRESMWLTRFDRVGLPTATYPVAADAVAAAFNVFGADTGLLPEGALFWQNRAGQARIGMWLEPAVRTIVWAAGKRDAALTIPLPGFVFVGHRTQYRIWAARRRPVTAHERLYAAPLPNVGGDGAICAGTVKFPVCDGESIGKAAKLFFESLFNYDLGQGKVRSSENLLTFLRKLRGQREFPLDRLVPSGMTMGDVITGGEG